MNSKVYKWCAVPKCKNTSIKTPNKVFVHVPQNKIIRDKWLKLARRNPNDVVTHSPLYFCEDHFDLPNDMENYMEYHVMGSVSQVRTKPGCMPKKFICQLDRRTQTSDQTEQPFVAKTRKMMTLQECDKYSEEKHTVTEQSSTEVAVSSSGLTQALYVDVKIERGDDEDCNDDLNHALDADVKIERGDDEDCNDDLNHALDADVKIERDDDEDCNDGLNHALDADVKIERDDDEDCNDENTEVPTEDVKKPTKKTRKPKTRKNEPKALTCNLCDKTFLWKNNLKRHMNVHDSGKQFNCNFCPKIFIARWNLNQHLRVHNNLKYECSVCGKCMRDRARFTRHVHEHSMIPRVKITDHSRFKRHEPAYKE